MSREIYIGFRLTDASDETAIEVRAPYFLFGTQQTSKAFWSLPIWKSIGLSHLAELGMTDPVYFIGWPMIDELEREIRLFENNLTKINFDPDVKSWFLAHLIYCHSLLVSTAPKDSIPELTIG
ncbi:hypothetical protein [Bremerella volcania]|nr:hypothetical protein [Bremerella volcania]